MAEVAWAAHGHAICVCLESRGGGGRQTVGHDLKPQDSSKKRFLLFTSPQKGVPEVMTSMPCPSHRSSVRLETMVRQRKVGAGDAPLASGAHHAAVRSKGTSDALGGQRSRPLINSFKTQRSRFLVMESYATRHSGPAKEGGGGGLAVP